MVPGRVKDLCHLPFGLIVPLLDLFGQNLACSYKGLFRDVFPENRLNLNSETVSYTINRSSINMQSVENQGDFLLF